MALKSVRIVGEGGIPSNGKYRVWIDDHDVSDYLISLTLNMGVGDVNTVAMTFLVSKVDVEGEALVKATLDEGPEATTFTSRFREWVGV